MAAANTFTYPSRSLHVVADIGGTNARLGERFKLGDSTIFDINRAYITDLKRLVAEIDRLRYNSSTEVASITLALAGLINPDSTGLSYAGNLTDWVGHNLVADLQREFGSECHVLLVNDAQAAAYAEACEGRDGSNLPFTLVIWGTGLNAVHVARDSQGKPLVLQSEFGHTTLPGAELRRCGCGQYGCAEAVLGGDRLLDRLNGGIYKSWQSITLEVAERQGFFNDMAIFLRNVIGAHAVPVILFSGGVANRQAGWLPKIQAKLQDITQLPVPKLRLARHNEAAGMIGAKYYSMHTFAANYSPL